VTTRRQAATRGLRFTPGPYDVRVERRIGRRQEVLWVRAVKRGQPLRYDPELFRRDALLSADPTTRLVVAVLRLVAVPVERLVWHPRIERSTTWKVGVIDPRGGRLGADRLLHRERLPKGVDPQARIAELVGEVEAGRFDPGRGPLG
jgi:hypothetical protein